MAPRGSQPPDPEKRDRGPDLDGYRAKRDFRRTPEPAPGAAARTGAEGSFVVHRHAARSLHFDLRLEVDGALASWAVPKGFSYDPRQKRLAVRTENHPMEYLEFEGVIPKGQYGAGSMTRWDHGSLRWLPGYGPGDVEGELKFVLDGRRLRGEWHLVRTAPRGERASQEHWLLFKAKDRYAGPDRDSAAAHDLLGAEPKPPPRRLTPMRPQGASAVFADPEWLFELDFVGRRALAYVDTERGTVRWSGLAEGPAPCRDGLLGLRATHAVVDGVLVATDAAGRPDRATLDAALAGDGAGVAFYAFDILHFDRFDLRPLPLRARKGILRHVLPEHRAVPFVDHVAADGRALADVVARAGLGGLLAKRADAPYTPGPSAAWRTVPLAADRALGVRAALEAGAGADAGVVRVTNRDKVLWPEDRITKGDLVHYYQRMAAVVWPYLEGRPLHLHRFPDGIHGPSFYQRHGEHALPEGVATLAVVDGEGRERRERSFLTCEQPIGVPALANLGSIDLHPWLSRGLDRSGGPPGRGWDRPDMIVWDFDPKGAPWRHVVELARACGELLTAIGLRPCLKTSGKEGLHVYVGLRPDWTFQQVGMFCEGVARLLVLRRGSIATIERGVHQRDGKVYIDVLQNRRGQSVVAPYSVRPCVGATVSTPLAWEELEDPELDPRRFHMLTVPRRVAELGDLFRPVLDDPQDLVPAIDALRGELEP